MNRTGSSSQISSPGRKVISRELPTWVDSAAICYFITICCQQRCTNQLTVEPIGSGLLNSAQYYQDKEIWFLHLFLLMPDHLHMLVSFGREQSMEKAVRAWKRYTARQFFIEWQRDFFERRLRSDESLQEKADYILQNPVRAKLASDGEHWPHTLIPK